MKKDMATLISLFGAGEDGKPIEALYSLEGVREAVVGRMPECSIRIQNDSLSRLHARFLQDGSVWCVEDLNSQNGVFLNGEKLSKAPLHEGDIISIGEIDLTLTYHEPHQVAEMSPWIEERRLEARDYRAVINNWVRSKREEQATAAEDVQQVEIQAAPALAAVVTDAANTYVQTRALPAEIVDEPTMAIPYGKIPGHPAPKLRASPVAPQNKGRRASAPQVVDKDPMVMILIIGVAALLILALVVRYTDWFN